MFSNLWPGWGAAMKRDRSNVSAHPDTAKAASVCLGDGTWVSRYTVGKVSAPSSSTDTGTEGQWAEDGDYFYVCVATDTWRRAPLNDWS